MSQPVRRGPFTYIALEGIDGAGKSTQRELITEYLRSRGIAVRVFHYTAKRRTFLGSVIRALYFNKKTTGLVRIARKSRFLQAVLYAFNARLTLRAVLHDRVPFTVLLGDRSVVTSLAFHEHIFQGPAGHLLWMCEPHLIPDHIVFLDIAPDVAFYRLQGRPMLGRDEHMSSLVAFSDAYARLRTNGGHRWLGGTRWHLVDAAKPAQLVFESVREILEGAILSARQPKP